MARKSERAWSAAGRRRALGGFAVTVGALVLEIQRHGRAEMAVEPHDFITAFVAVGLISAASAFIFMRLPKSAGASLSGPARPIATAQEQVATGARVDV